LKEYLSEQAKGKSIKKGGQIFQRGDLGRVRAAKGWAALPRGTYLAAPEVAEANDPYQGCTLKT
jgi:hypothetical protein